ncbi:MAG: TonB-dependent receptor [Hyphomonadaceae bacterium]
MRRVLKVALFTATALAAPVAHAEDPEIVVTATRAASTAERLPARTEVIDRADIETGGLVSLPEALGVEAVQSGGAGQQTSLFLRGANSKHALSLFDGIRLNDASTPNAQYDFGLDTLGGIERVEILRGPASAIYGSDAVGGVINMLPRRGGATAFAPFLELAGGSYESRRVLAGAVGSNGGFDYGVSAEKLETDGYDLIPERMITHTGDADAAAISTFTASARYELSALSVDALLRVRESETEFDTFSGGVGFDLRADDPDLENEATQTVWRIGADGEIGGVTLRLSGGQVLSDRSETDGGFETSAAESTRDFADASATFARDGMLLVGGLAFERNEIDTRPQFSNPLVVGEDQFAGYVLSQFNVARHVVATGSVRVDDYENFGAQTTYSLGAVVTFGDVRAFASYGTAFKAPSLSERFETSFFNVGNPDLDPEESASWEIGGDWDVAETLRVGASYYQSRIDNLIEYDFLQSMNVNLGEAEIDGAEVYAEAAPTNWSSLRVSYMWTDARNGQTGAQLARRPEHAWGAELRLRPNDRLSLGAAWTYVGDRIDVTYNDNGTFRSGAEEIDGFNLGAVFATFDIDERAQIFARVDNVTDESYEQPAAFAGAPRSVTLGLRASY